MANYNPIYAAKLSVVLGILSFSGLVYSSAGAVFAAIAIAQGVRGLRCAERRTAWLGIGLACVGLILTLLKLSGVWVIREVC